MQKLSRLITVSTAARLWVQVRHLLGRLCSWFRAARFLVLASCHFHDRIQGAELEIAHRPDSLRAPENLPWSNPQEALSELFPNYDETRLENALQKRQESKLLNPITNSMHRMAQGELKLQLHAEIVLLNHFKLKNLAFIDGDRYLGCSKPSCYCCDLYIRNHPGNYAPRPCHGNIWTKWAVPASYYEDQDEEVLQSMLSSVKVDLIHHIIYGSGDIHRVPDSTTGLVSTEPRY